MRVTKVMLEKSIRGLLKTNRQLRGQNEILKRLLKPNLWLVEPASTPRISILDFEPSPEQFNLGQGYNAGSEMVSNLCRDGLEALVGKQYMPTMESYTEAVIVPLKRFHFLPTLVASQRVLR